MGLLGAEPVEVVEVSEGDVEGAARPDLVRSVARVSLRLAVAFVAIVMTTFLIGTDALASAIGFPYSVASVRWRRAR